jgi:hypothetical protein
MCRSCRRHYARRRCGRPATAPYQRLLGLEFDAILRNPKKEGLILLDWTSDRLPKLVAMQWRNRSVEKVFRVKSVVRSNS